MWLFTVSFDKRLIAMHKVTALWARIFFFLNPIWKLNIDGNENIQYLKKYIIVSNHQSILDIVILFHINAHYKWVSKSEIFKIPLIGWGMSMNRYIKIVRSNFRSIPKMMSDCKIELGKGSSVLIFPEGTRSDDGTIKKFKDGAFQLALDMKVPVLPVVLNGTADVISKGKILLQKRKNLKIKVLDEMPYEEFMNMTKKELSKVVYNRMNDAFNEMK